MNANDAIVLLTKARAAAQAVKDEIDRLNGQAGDPDDVARREPQRQRAVSLISDTDKMIDDLQASQVSVNLDASMLAHLTTLAADLDRKIAVNALVNVRLDTLTQVLENVSNVTSAVSGPGPGH